MAVNQGNQDMQTDHDPQLAGLYRAVAAQDPPQRLDAAIQAAARRAVGARPRPADVSFLRAWRVPVSIAAVLVLSVSMVTLTVRQKSEQAAGERLMDPAFTASAPAFRADPAPRPAEVPSAPAAAQKQHDAPPVPRAVARDAAAVRSQAAEAVPPAAPGYAASPPGSSVLAERRMAPATAEGVAPAQATPTPASPVAPASVPQLSRSELVADSAKTGDASGVAEWIRAYDKEQPGRWLEKIETLRREGRIAEAGEMLAEFRKRFPEHPLPADLR